MRQDQLGVQAHCLRFRIGAGFEQALAEVAGLGLQAIELVSFPGCRGNAWGDFGTVSDWRPADIGAAIRAAGLRCPSAMVGPQELADGAFDRTVAWLRAVGIPRLVLTSLATPGNGARSDWRQAFAGLNVLGARVADSGLQFAYHTQPDLWALIEGARPADELLQAIDPARCRIEFDPSGAIIHGADPAAYIRQRPDCFYALHLRDGARPPQPVFYLAAEPLGTGEVDWPALLAAAGASAIEWYFLEMEVSDPAQTLAAIAASQRYLHRHGLVS